MRTEKSCGAIIFKKIKPINSEKESLVFLIVREIKKHGGHWNFPKGHVEKDETELETAKREIMEELKMEIDIIDGFREEIKYRVKINKSEKTVIYFLAIPKTEQIELQKSELADFAWLGYEECLKKLTFENSKELFKNA